jgi:hypothetical protein
MPDFRVADAVTLAHCNVHAVMHDYNSQLSNDTILNLDLEGTNLLQPLMVHEHANGEKVEPHMRVQAYIKLRGKDEPFQQIMDVTMEDWNNLVPVHKETSNGEEA